MKPSSQSAPSASSALKTQAMPQGGLRREIGLRSLFTLGFGTIIGVGWITVLGSLLTSGGSLGAILAFAAGSLVMVAIGLCYAELASLYAVSGGEVVYTYEMYGPMLSFIAGWFLAFNYIAVTAFEAISVGWITATLIPGIDGPVLYTVLGQEVRAGSLILSLGVMAVIIWVNFRGAKSAALFQDIVTGILIVASLIFILFGLSWGSVENLPPLFVVDRPWYWGVLAVFATTPFWFMGFNIIPQGLGELDENAQTHLVPRVIIFSVLLAGLFYCLVILTAAMSLPRDELLSFDLPIVGAFNAAFQSPTIGKIILLAGLCGLISTWNALFFAATRVVFTLGRARLAPLAFSRIHPRFGSPLVAVLFVGAVATLVTLMGRNAILPIVNTSSSALAFILLLVVAGVTRLRRRHAERPAPYRVPASRFVLPIATVSAFAMLIASLYEPLHNAPSGAMPAEWIILILWSALGVFIWWRGSAVRGDITEAERRQLILGYTNDKL